tara:strand:+ start:1286 stop:2056 length:771 start_codon:yes stop_codon:yes gene_type:complete
MILKHGSFAENISAKWRSAVLVCLAVTLTGCGQLGPLLSNDKVTDADNDEVVFVGDSIFALSGKIQDELEEKAGQTFRRYTVSGAELSGTGALAPSIPDQFREAYGDNPNIKTIVGDAGGNDILLPAIAFDPNKCKTRWYQFGGLSQSCKDMIDDLYVEGVDFLNEVSDSGVENGVLLGYYYTKNGLFRLASLKEAVDYGNQVLARACRNSTLDCTFVDPRNVIVNSDIIFDGIHPADSGSEKLAELIWPELEPLL